MILNWRYCSLKLSENSKKIKANSLKWLKVKVKTINSLKWLRNEAIAIWNDNKFKLMV